MKTLALLFCVALCGSFALGSVVLSHFEAFPGDHHVNFQWGTSSETNNYFFEIFRNDTMMVQIQGHNTTQDPHEYTWVDDSVNNETRYTYGLWAGSNTGLDSITSVTVIPPHWVALGRFSAQTGVRTVQLNWLVLSEINNVRFEITRDSMWVGAVTGHGNNNIPHSYSWVDTAAADGARYMYVLWAVNYNAAHDPLDSAEVTLSAGDSRADLPASLNLAAYPNPFNPTTTLAFNLPATQRVHLVIYDLVGRARQTLADGILPAGEHRTSFDASALPSGIYFARLTGKNFSVTQKLLLLK